MRVYYFFILFVGFGSVSAQNYSGLINATPIFVEEISLGNLKNNQLFISMPFAKNNILNPDQKKLLNEKVAIKIELVYTRYRQSNSFNQQKLNEKRLKELNRLAPQLFENRFWDFQLISQTKGSSPQECNPMFHGFIITFRPNSTSNTLAQEADYIDALADALILQDSIKNDTINKKYIIKTHYDQQVGYLHDTIWYEAKVKKPSPPNFFYNQSLYNDSTVFNVFERNQSWDNLIIVTDVTGSMSPYISQVIVWLKAQAEKKTARYFVFFNDGDQKDSHKKKPLETKGIYVQENNSFDAVKEMATKCMNNGSGGGEWMENDVEAIIEGEKQYSKADAVVLVADNMEMMRDYDYIKKIKKPVHVVLCGAEHRANLQYLDLARQTKGSLHTVYSDITDLHLKKENEHFFIDDKEYMYKNGRFHAVYGILEIYK